jgi:hypothetical protein
MTTISCSECGAVIELTNSTYALSSILCPACAPENYDGDFHIPSEATVIHITQTKDLDALIDVFH